MRVEARAEAIARQKGVSPGRMRDMVNALLATHEELDRPTARRKCLRLPKSPK